MTRAGGTWRRRLPPEPVCPPWVSVGCTWWGTRTFPARKPGPVLSLAGAATSTSFVATKALTCFDATKVCLSRQNYVCQWQQAYFCHDKKNVFCRDKHVFVTTKSKLVATKVLLRQKTCFVATNTCLKRRDKYHTCGTSRQWYCSRRLTEEDQQRRIPALTTFQISVYACRPLTGYKYYKDIYSPVTLNVYAGICLGDVPLIQTVPNKPYGFCGR